MPISLDTPVHELHRHGISGVGTVMAAKLAAALAPHSSRATAEEVTVDDLLHYFPARYEDRSKFISIDELRDGMDAAIEIYVRTAGGAQVGKNRERWKPPLYLFEIVGGDKEHQHRPVVVKWFISGKNAKHILEYQTNRFKRGTRFVAYGTWEFDDRKGTFALKTAKPEELEVIDTDTEESADELDELAEDTSSAEFSTVHTARCVPVYRKLGPFQTKRLREIIYAACQQLDRTSKDQLPTELIERHNLISRLDALVQVHFPPDEASVADYEMFRSAAQRRLIFDEFFWLAFSMQLLRCERTSEPKGSVIEVSDATKKRLNEMLPFKLTDAQKRVIGEIFADLKSDHPMNRLIQGDVGSGKTIVAFLAMAAAMENGYQTAFMAPTEILAEQHFRNAKKLFAGTEYHIELLTGSMKAAAKRRVRDGLELGVVDLVIGTHALIQDAVKFKDLALAVIDEQHRFGVLQRAHLKKAGRDPDILVMTATPIPRSLAMTVYGDLDVSIIDELPPGRTPVKTVVLGEDKRAGVYRGIEREIKLGRQVYVVYPLIEESEKMDLKAATAMYDKMRLDIFPQYTVGLLHGKMKPVEKEAVMSEFVGGRLDILVSTTVIEVGVDVPNASLMVIEHAERFGLSQLHQLRGRIGRGADQSYCVLLADYKRTAVAKERLGIMEETSDGFLIAEKDLELRGQGEILGTRQSGIRTFKLANIVRDLEILVTAKKEAEFYAIEKRLSPETTELVKTARSHKNVSLGSIA
ncbi:MAG: ATP-dependent DNA helicase RecG [Blastocatellia bacterium]|nr:ATP-dependent DNA helicase RecG [Blastocatellia bacterium]